MAASPPPRYAVHPVHKPPAQPRRWLGWVLVWLASLIFTAVLAVYLTGRTPIAPKSGAADNPQQLAAQVADLKQQLAIARRSQQVANVATKKLTDNLADRDQKISGLRADLAFYSRLVGGGTQHDGLQLQMAHVQPVAGSRAWNITLVLTRNAKRGNQVSGTASVAIDGVRGGQLSRLRWDQIVGPDQKKGLPFKFKYFQQLHGTVMLPKGFTPNRLRINVTPHGGHTTTKTMSWTDALKNPENDHVEQ